jgi:hypothetical protein
VQSLKHLKSTAFAYWNASNKEKPKKANLSFFILRPPWDFIITFQSRIRYTVRPISKPLCQTFTHRHHRIVPPTTYTSFPPNGLILNELLSNTSIARMLFIIVWLTNSLSSLSNLVNPLDFSGKND